MEQDENLELSDMATTSVVVQAVNEYRQLLQQQIALHLKRQRDRIVRMRQRFVSKLAHRLHRNYMLYRRKRRHLMADVALVTPKRKASQRKVYNRSWWNSFTERKEPVNEIELMEEFRMDYGTFRFLLDQLETELTTSSVFNNAPLSSKLKISIAIYVLGSGKDYRSTGAKFGVHHTTVHRSLHAFCRAVIKVFRAKVVKMPLERECIERAAKEFTGLAGIPQVIGIIDCLHIPINQPASESTQYVNSKGWNSIILQAMVDRHGRFLNLSCKHPGRTKDAEALIGSELYQTMEQLELPGKTIDGIEVQPLLLGDSGYPLLPWLITPYSSNNLKPDERSFNVYVAKARNGIQGAFERLLGRWKVLNRCMTMDINFIPDVVLTCCILHNIVERLGSPYQDHWSECQNDEDVAPEQPHWVCPIVSDDGEVVRNHLCKYMLERFPVITDDED